jgi:VWFA-related protein
MERESSTTTGKVRGRSLPHWMRFTILSLRRTGWRRGALYKPSPMDVGGTIASKPANTNPMQGAERAYAESMEAAAVSSTLLAFQEIAEYVKDVPGRKSLIWITAGFPFSIEPETCAVSLGVPSHAYEQTMHLLSTNMISVYSVDARGLVRNRPHDILDTMRIFSAMTGGRAYLNTNDIRAAVSEAVGDGSAYYLLSYPVDKGNKRQGWRKISVHAGKYRVRARTGYLMTSSVANSQHF